MGTLWPELVKICFELSRDKVGAKIIGPMSVEVLVGGGAGKQRGGVARELSSVDDKQYSPVFLGT